MATITVLADMTRTRSRIRVALIAAAAAALCGGLVHAVLVAAHVSEPAASTVHGLTARRRWATTVAMLAVVGVVVGGLALARPRSSGQRYAGERGISGSRSSAPS